MLTARLRSLEADGILTRTVYPELPLRVEYGFTDLGRELRPVIDALAAWGALPADTGGPAGAQTTGTAGPPVERGCGAATARG